ncbi:hypothetical protein ACHQM5_021600 [Ranunculus cassubicifolius]
MNSMATTHCQNFKLSSNNKIKLSFTNPISSSISFKSSPHSKTLIKPLKLSSHLHLNPKAPNTQTQNPFFTLLKTTSITLITTTLFLTRFTKPSLATPITQPPSISQPQEQVESDEEKERFLQEYVDSHPNDVKGLKALMGIKIQVRKFDEAIAIIEKLIQLEPLEKEWPLLKAHVYSYGGDIESAKLGFEEVISENPLSVEAYHGLIMAAAQSESDDLGDVVKRIESSMEICRKEKKKDDYRDFKLLAAQVRIVEGKYTDALKVYQELVKEEPRDFRPYLCQGIIYTLLKNQDEADKQFEKYRRLVPQGHPYARYFEDNMLATKLFSQMGSKS